MNPFKKIASVFNEGATAARGADGENKFRVSVFFDYIHCRHKYHASAREYLRYHFYNHKDRYRKNYLLQYHQLSDFKKINEKAFTYWKYKFYQKIPDCFCREIILAPACGEEAFLEYFKKHGKIVTKPDTGSLGRDVRILAYTDDQKAREFFAELQEDTVCEELICQHEELSRMNPDSVNTIRFVSLRQENDVEIISATLRTGGQAGVIIDNLKKDGVGAQIDVATGIINTHGFDYHDNIYVNHPVSGVQFLGFNIPNWEQAVELVKKAHWKLPQCAMLGWDIAITQDGADIIEANSRPGVPIMQMVHLEPKGEKILKAVREAKKKKCK